MSASAIFILDSKGKVLIYRNYRDDVDMNIIEKFLSIVIEREEEGQISPVIHYEGSSFIYVKYNYLYLVALTKRNANASIVFAFLYRLINVSCANINIFVLSRYFSNTSKILRRRVYVTTSS